MSWNPNRRRTGATPVQAEQPRRRLKTKPLLILILILLVGNFLWFVAWLIPDSKAEGTEKVASVDGDDISRQEWMLAMEEQHGRSVLLELVNEKVMETAAEEYGIEVAESEIDLEMAMLRSAQDETDMTLYASQENRMRDKIKAQLILEKVLTKDVVIEEAAVKEFYDENQELYDIKEAYRARMIVVESAEEAQKTIEELESGSSFEALARERSIDTATGSLGGDIGYVTPEQTTVDEAVAEAVGSIDVGEWSSPLNLEDGRIAIVSVTDKVAGQAFSYEDVADRISRELALEQLPQSVTPEAFWQEFDAQWFYGE
ncbi:peptidyl-prolyl cis-trans isomerase [Planococcus salinus]|uniref:peptidylprolyl isomerase n=1 Tax=Planococcus salinus TaxID=1848460 RepID=A0A3M8P4S0_9BACL|nr:peptidyl-prolyl cis-trans isomerase [Planococcus salinus]RNF38350.1 foldase [Planococcus salinus]